MSSPQRAGSVSTVRTYAGLNGRPLGLLISTIATTGFLLFGYDQGVMSGIISADPFNNYFPSTKNNSVYQGFVTAIYEIGCLIGAIFILSFGDKTGRRRDMMLGGFIMITGVIIQITAVKGHRATAQFIIGRTITGVGNGINTSTIPTYQAECSRTANRGLLICIEGGVIAFGTMIAYWIDYGASYGPDNLTWRFPIAFQIVFGIILIAGTWFLPESPRWLLTKDRHEEGINVIAALSGLETTDPETQLQHSLIIDSIKASGHSGGKTPMSALFTGGKTQHFRRMLLGSSSQFFQQLGGCNAVILLFSHLISNLNRHLPQPCFAARRRKHDRLRHICDRQLVHHRASRPPQALPRRNSRSMPLHGPRLRLPDPQRGQRTIRQGGWRGPFHIHRFLRRNMAASPMALPRRNQPSPHPCKSQRRLHLLQLAVQLPNRHGYTSHDRQHSLGHVALLRYRQRLFPPYHLLLLPGD